jgi:anti-sigma factor RsiW
MADMPCQQVVELVTSYLDGSIGWRDRRRFEKHLRGCDACDRYLEQMRETLDLLGTIPVDALSAEAQSALFDAFRDFPR